MVAFYQKLITLDSIIFLCCVGCVLFFPFSFSQSKVLTLISSPQFLHFLQALGTSIPHDPHFWKQNSKKKLFITCLCLSSNLKNTKKSMRAARCNRSGCALSVAEFSRPWHLPLPLYDI